MHSSISLEISTHLFAEEMIITGERGRRDFRLITLRQ